MNQWKCLKLDVRTRPPAHSVIPEPPQNLGATQNAEEKHSPSLLPPLPLIHVCLVTVMYQPLWQALARQPRSRNPWILYSNEQERDGEEEGKHSPSQQIRANVYCLLRNFPYINSFNPLHSLQERYYFYFHFTDEGSSPGDGNRKARSMVTLKAREKHSHERGHGYHSDAAGIRSKLWTEEWPLDVVMRKWLVMLERAESAEWRKQNGRGPRLKADAGSKQGSLCKGNILRDTISDN